MSKLENEEKIIPKIKYNEFNKIVFQSNELLDIILNNIELTREPNNSDYKVFSDSRKYGNLENYEQNKYFNLFSKITVPISVNLLIFSIGISTESKKIEKLILKNNHKDIVIIIENWEMLSSEVQDFILILLKNKEKFIKRYSKNSITIVYGATNINDKLNDYFFDNIIEYGNLSLKDSFLLIQQYTDFNDIDYKLFEEIYKINIGDFSRILTTLKLTREYEYKLSEGTLEKLLNNILIEVDEKIKFKNISNKKILELFSLFPKCFDPYEIVNIDVSVDKYELEKNIDILENLFVLFKHEMKYTAEYSMLLQLKNKLLNSDSHLKKEIFQLYYQYLTEFFPLDFKRRIDVQINYLKDEYEILYQYILLYDYYFINDMKYNIECLIEEFENINISNMNKKFFRDIVNFKYNNSLTLSQTLCDIRDDRIHAFLLKKDIEYYSTNIDYSVRLKNLCNILHELVIIKNCFKNNPLMKAIYITILIPQYADKFNDINKANMLVEEFNCINSKSATAQEHIEYYKNILNRKSYLFYPTDLAILKCKSVLKFFEEKNDIKEIYITLNTLLSLYVINDELELAEECKSKIIDMYVENLPQFYKSEMNFILLDIISGKSTNYKEILSRYITILNKDITITSKNIILTNLCSLALENNDFKIYKKYKNEFETLNNIEDVSDINNELIDDFYRYYFAWFELGKNLICGNKQKAKELYKKLEHFVPTIYKSEYEILNYKYKCFENIFKSDIKSGRNFSEYAFERKNNFRNWKFLSRGFMLTDIHHTSII